MQERQTSLFKIATSSQTVSSPENFYVTFPGESSKDSKKNKRPVEIDEIELCEARQMSRDRADDPGTSGESSRSKMAATPADLAYESPIVTKPKYQNQQ